MPLQKDPLSPKSNPLSPKNDFSNQKSFWALIIILFLSGFLLLSQHYLRNAPVSSETIKTISNAPHIDKSISLPILSENEIEEALASPKTSSEIKEALLAASHNKRLRLVKMPIQTNATEPLPFQITTSGITQKLILTQELQSVLLPIDRTGLLNMKLISAPTDAKTVIAFDNFGPFPLQFQPIKNTEITLLVISQ